MAVTERMEKNVARMLLNNGTDTQGNVTTVTVNLGTLSDTGWDAEKAFNIMEAIEACLTKTIYQKQHVLTNRLVEE